MNNVLVAVVMAFCAVGLNAQTFQYSRGWTNGKRSNLVVTEQPPLRQMMPMIQVLTANDLNSKERLIQQIIKNPCDLRMAVMSHSFKPNDDYMASTADGNEDDNRFKRELLNH